MPRAWTRRCVTQQGPQFARTEGLFLFARGNACDDRTPSRRQARGLSRAGNLCSPATGTGVPLLFLKEGTMSAASQVNAHRPIGVLLGGSFAPQRSVDPKPVVCALLRPRSDSPALPVRCTRPAPLLSLRTKWSALMVDRYRKKIAAMV